MNLIIPKSFQFIESIGVATKVDLLKSVFANLTIDTSFAEAKNDEISKARSKIDLCIS